MIIAITGVPIRRQIGDSDISRLSAPIGRSFSPSILTSLLFDSVRPWFIPVNIVEWYYYSNPNVKRCYYLITLLSVVQLPVLLS
ncbi:hypothetical protein TNCV_4500751 [Trichonephila clavipes]|nr:hypothetical protein TNCV_4500751 [Trichonephila clavipes]